MHMLHIQIFRENHRRAISTPLLKFHMDLLDQFLRFQCYLDSYQICPQGFETPVLEIQFLATK